MALAAIASPAADAAALLAGRSTSAHTRRNWLPSACARRIGATLHCDGELVVRGRLIDAVRYLSIRVRCLFAQT